MFNRKVRKARRRYEMERLRSMMEENQRRLRELDALRNGPCPACVRRGWA